MLSKHDYTYALCAEGARIVNDRPVPLVAVPHENEGTLFIPLYGLSRRQALLVMGKRVMLPVEKKPVYCLTTALRAVVRRFEGRIDYVFSNVGVKPMDEERRLQWRKQIEAKLRQRWRERGSLPKCIDAFANLDKWRVPDTVDYDTCRTRLWSMWGG